MIWCVDDDSTIRDIEVYTLEQTGFQARGFADGASLLEALQSEIPELIVLDIMMPGMDGVEVLKILRSEPKFQEIPVIMRARAGGVSSISPLYSIYYMVKVTIAILIERIR